MDNVHQSTHMPTVIALAFLVISIVGEAVAFSYVFGQLHNQVSVNSALSQTNERQIAEINSSTNAKLDSLSTQLSLTQQSRHYDESLLYAIAQKIGVNMNQPKD